MQLYATVQEQFIQLHEKAVRLLQGFLNLLYIGCKCVESSMKVIHCSCLASLVQIVLIILSVQCSAV